MTPLGPATTAKTSSGAELSVVKVIALRQETSIRTLLDACSELHMLCALRHDNITRLSEVLFCHCDGDEEGSEDCYVVLKRPETDLRALLVRH